MEDEKIIQLLDQRFAKVDERFAKIDEQFRQAAMKTERVENAVVAMKTKVELVDYGVRQLSDEMKLPSGVIAQLGRRIDAVATDARLAHVSVEAVRAEIKQVAEGVASSAGKLEQFRTETEENFDDVRERIKTANEQLGKRIADLEHATG